MTSRQSRSGKQRHFTLAAVTVLGVSLLALLAVEMYLRLTGFKYELRVHVVESTAPEADEVHRAFMIDPYLVWVNKQYYERLSRARQGAVDIVFMGDSCTQFGKYDSYLRELFERVNIQAVNTVNLGVAGWTTYQGLKQIERDVARLRPKIVTIYYGWNDHWLSIGLDDEQVGCIISSPLRFVQGLRLGQLVTKAWVVLVREDDKPVVRVGGMEFYDNLVKIVQEAKRSGSIPVLITAPSSHTEGREPVHLEGRWIANISDLIPAHQHYVDIVRRVAEEEDVVLCDLAAGFGSLPGDIETLYECFYGDGIHFTDKGSFTAAGLLFECFEENGLLEILKTDRQDADR